MKKTDLLNKLLPYVAFGGIGLFMWYKNKKESQLSGIDNINNFSFGIDKERVIDFAINCIPLSPVKKELVRTIKNGFMSGYKK